MPDKNTLVFPKPISKYMYATGSEVIDNQVDGMTLRQYYAAKAMQGLLASETESSGYGNEQVSDRAFKIADAMIKYEQEEQCTKQEGKNDNRI